MGSGQWAVGSEWWAVSGWQTGDWEWCVRTRVPSSARYLGGVVSLSQAHRAFVLKVIGGEKREGRREKGGERREKRGERGRITM